MKAAFAVSWWLLLAFGTSASAQVIGVSLNYFAQYDENTDSTEDAIFAADLFTTNLNDITGATVTVPDGTTSSLQQLGTDWSYSHSSPSTYDMAYLFPDGTYTVNTTGGTVGLQTYSLTASGELPVEQEFTGDTIYGLSHDSTTAPITVTFQPFSSDPNANHIALSLILVGNGISNTYDLSPSATQYTIAAHTLAPGKNYTLELYEENEYLSGAPAGSDSYNIYESQTSLGFATAAPEPAILTLTALGMAGLIVVRYLHSRILY